MVVGINATRNAEANEIQATKSVLTRNRIAVGQYITDLASTDTCLQIQLASERLSWELLLRHFRKDLIGIYKDSMTTGRPLIRDTILIELAGQVLHLTDARLNHVELKVLAKTYCQCIHVSTIHTAIRKEAFKRNAECLSCLIPVLLTSSDKAAHVYETVFLGRHRHRVSIREHLASDFSNRLILITLFAGLDEISIFNEACRVHIYGYAILMAKGANLTNILHRNGLTTYRVVRYSKNHYGYITLVLFQHFLQKFKRYIALKRQLELGIVRFGNRYVNSFGFAEFNMTFGRIEMRITRNNHPRLNDSREQHVLSCTTLMGRDNILKTRDVANRVAEMEERTSACIALIAHHHSRPLTI